MPARRVPDWSCFSQFTPDQPLGVLVVWPGPEAEVGDRVGFGAVRVHPCPVGDGLLEVGMVADEPVHFPVSHAAPATATVPEQFCQTGAQQRRQRAGSARGR
jgi:hypothetical protein